MRNALRLAVAVSAVFASAAFAAPAAPDTVGANLSADRQAACAAICDRKDNASCKNARPIADCVSTCATFVKETPAPCLKKWDDWIARENAARWTCDAHDFPKAAGSTVESVEFWECIQKQKPEPKFPVCASSSGDGPYCPNCMMSLCQEPSLACGRNADCRAMNSCLSSCDPRGDDTAKQGCIAKCTAKHKVGTPLWHQLSACYSESCDAQCNGNVPSFGYKDENDHYQSVGIFLTCGWMFP